MTDEEQYKKWWLIIKPLGAYPVRKWAWTFDQILDETIEKLEQNKTILIFPEGQRIKKNKKIKPKLGAAYLASKLKLTIIPIKLSRVRDKSIFTTKGGFSMKVGKPLDVRSMKGMKLGKKARKMMDSVYNL